MNGQAALRVDLVQGLIEADSHKTWHFEIAAHARTRLLEGLDDVGLTLKHLSAIEAWEARTARQRPFMQACSAIKPSQVI